MSRDYNTLDETFFRRVPAEVLAQAGQQPPEEEGPKLDKDDPYHEKRRKQLILRGGIGVAALLVVAIGAGVWLNSRSRRLLDTAIEIEDLVTRADLGSLNEALEKLSATEGSTPNPRLLAAGAWVYLTRFDMYSGDPGDRSQGSRLAGVLRNVAPGTAQERFTSCLEVVVEGGEPTACEGVADLQVEPELSWMAGLLTARAALEAGNPRAAAATLEQAPVSPLTRYWLGESYRELGRSRTAIEAYQEAYVANSAFSLAELRSFALQGRQQDPAAHLVEINQREESVAGSSPRQLAVLVADHYLTLLRLGRELDASRLIEQAREGGVESRELEMLRASDLRRRGMFTRARGLLDRLIRERPGDGAALAEYALVAFYLDWGPSLEGVLERAPSTVQAGAAGSRARGAAKLMFGNGDDGLPDLRRGVDADETGEGSILVIEALLDLERFEEATEEAEGLTQRAIERYHGDNPLVIQGELYQGLAAAGLDNRTRAREALRRAADYLDHPLVAFLAGRLREELGDLGGAAEYYERAGQRGQDFALSTLHSFAVYRRQPRRREDMLRSLRLYLIQAPHGTAAADIRAAFPDL